MSASRQPWTASGMKEANAPLEAEVREFLEKMVAAGNEKNHALFLNMLSMLEHMGSRKIMLSQMDKTLTEDTLKHLAEEARHAYFFKRQAEKIAKKSIDGFTPENTSCRNAALMYFGRLDAGISQSVMPRDPYPWVSLIIELRACWLYAIYQDVLEKSDVKISLKSLLAEEDMHLAEMFEACEEDDEKLQNLSAYETKLFSTLFVQLQNYFGIKTLEKAA